MKTSQIKKMVEKDKGQILCHPVIPLECKVHINILYEASPPLVRKYRPAPEYVKTFNKRSCSRFQ